MDEATTILAPVTTHRPTLDSGTIIYAKPDNKTLERRLKRGMYIFEDECLYKRCGRCKEHWPADSEFFYSAKNEADGLNSWCKACYIENRFPNGRGAIH